nr:MULTISPECIES: hypothetical protein [unclassified Frankia]
MINGSGVRRPDDMFDREAEWASLSRFATDATPGATLGVVTGRRRQGKSFLLEAVCEQTGGLYFQATEATEATEATAAESLRRFGAHLSEHVGALAPLAPST